jgi:Tubulin binding cofactor A
VKYLLCVDSSRSSPASSRGKGRCPSLVFSYIFCFFLFRLEKELGSYKKEAEQQQRKLDKLKADGTNHDDWEWNLKNGVRYSTVYKLFDWLTIYNRPG